MDNEQPPQAPDTQPSPPNPPVSDQPAPVPVVDIVAPAQTVLQPSAPEDSKPTEPTLSPVGVGSVSVTIPSVTPDTLSNGSLPTVAQQPVQPQPILPQKKRGMLHNRKRIALLVVTLLFAFISAVAVYFVLAHRDSQNKVAELEKLISVLGADTHELPEGAIEVSECIPNMGHHYIDPASDPRFGPYYLVSKQGKVIGLEYMFNNSMLTHIPAEIDLEVLLTDGPTPLHGWQYQSIEFARSTTGHPGFAEDHIDVHVYTVTPEEQKRACE